MAWTITDWTPGNIQQYADELWKALEERQKASGNSINSIFPVTGANIQTGISAAPTTTTGKFGWRYIQDQIASICTSFVRSHNDSGVALATDYYDGQATIEMWTFANLMKAVRGGTAQSDFRRATSYPTDWANWADANYSVGKIALGTPRDIFGPWIPTDIQKALNMLVWTKNPTLWGTDEDNRRQVEAQCDEYASPPPCNWAFVKTEAETDWDGNAADNYGSTPTAYSQGFRQTPSWNVWHAYLYRQFSYLAGSGLWAGCKRAIDYYAKATKFRDAFDAYGDDVLEDLWSLWETETPDPPLASFASPTALGKVGDGDKPNNPWCGEPAPDSYSGRGYQIVDTVDDGVVIARWNITDGFVYV